MLRHKCLFNACAVTNYKNNNNHGNKKIKSSKTVSLPATGHTNVTTSTGQTARRIGSIGRTTIACITPANETPGAVGGVDVVSAAALTAAGVELDEVPIDCMTEVIVKIENTNCGSSENGNDNAEGGSEEFNEMRLMFTKNNKNSGNANNSVNHSDGEDEPENDEDFNNLSLKISSPMSWAYDAVKIEPDEEEFEQMMCVASAAAADHDEADNNDDDEDDDDLLTTAAATSKQAAHNAKVKSKDSMILKSTRSRQQNQSQKKQQELLLEQQQHLHHLQLQPNQRNSLQLTLAGIPATISKITNGSTTAASSKLIINESNNNNESNQTVKAEYKSSVSEDKRYRILIQNQRMRKESLEHSADMIYNADIEKPWVCRNCNRNYKWKNSLKCHLKNECGQPPRYFCSKLCGYATNVHSNLKRHLNTKCRDRLDDGTYKNTSTTTTGNSPNCTVPSSPNTSNNCSNYTLVVQKQD